jgi:cullin 1
MSFKFNTNLPDLNPEDTWHNKIIPNAIEPLIALLDGGVKGNGIDNKIYRETYALCYTLCTQKTNNFASELQQRHTMVIENYLIQTVLPSLQDKSNLFLLQEINQRWTNHKLMNRWMSLFFQYLDRYHLQYHKLPCLHIIGLTIFKNIICLPLKLNVTACIMSEIERERDGNCIDRYLIKSVYFMFSEVCELKQQLPQEQQQQEQQPYYEYVEDLLLISTHEYYSSKSAIWISNYDIPGFLKKVQDILVQEEERVQVLFERISFAKVLDILILDLLNMNKIEIIENNRTGFRIQLLNLKYEELQFMFQMLSKLPVDDGIVLMSSALEKQMFTQCEKCLSDRKNRIESLSEKEREKEAGQDYVFIKDLISIYDLYHDMIMNQFDSNAIFLKSLRTVFTEIMNEDSQYIEILVAFCDSLLKSGGEKISEDEIDLFLKKNIILFSHFSDKDIFVESYRDLLAKRLLNQRSLSNEMERNMIYYLKNQCGAQFTSKLEGMLNDLVLGSEHKTQFDEYRVSKNIGSDIDFSVQTLTMGFWPTYKLFDGLLLPLVMNSCVDSFTHFYHEEMQLQSRRLQWNYGQGNVEIRGKFGKNRYDIQIVTLQAIVLMVFDQLPFHESLSYFEIRKRVKLSDDVLKRILHSFACGKIKILKKTGEATKINMETDTFSVLEKFVSKTRKFRIPMASLDDNKNVKKVEEDRGIQIEAAIVRIMKSRKILSNQELFAEVLVQLSMFQPSVKAIRQHVEALIDREYLRRDPDDRTKCHYIA